MAKFLIDQNTLNSYASQVQRLTSNYVVRTPSEQISALEGIPTRDSSSLTFSNGWATIPSGVYPTQVHKRITGVYLGEYIDSERYYPNDVVTYNGGVYVCITDTYNNTGLYPDQYLGMYWNKLGGESGGSSGSSYTAELDGSYSTNGHYYLGGHANYPAQFEITEHITGTYRDGMSGEGGMFDSITILGSNGSQGAPIHTLILKNGGSTILSRDGYELNGYGVSMYLSGTFTVSKFFYDVFMDIAG